MAFTDKDLDAIQAMPGYVCIEIAKTGERKTRGGIVLPDVSDEKKSGFEMGVGAVISCGPYYCTQSGLYPTDADMEHGQLVVRGLSGPPSLLWPLPPGTRVLFHPHNPWPRKTDSGREFHVIKCVDIMAVLP